MVHCHVGDERVRPHLAALAAIDELRTLVGAMQERGSFTPEELRAVLVEVRSFREAGRVDDFVEVTNHAMAIAEAMAWRRLRAEIANIQGMNRLLQWRLEQAGRCSRMRLASGLRKTSPPRWGAASSTWRRCITSAG